MEKAPPLFWPFLFYFLITGISVTPPVITDGVLDYDYGGMIPVGKIGGFELRLVPRLELISDLLLFRSMLLLKVPPNYFIRESDSTLPP